MSHPLYDEVMVAYDECNDADIAHLLVRVSEYIERTNIAWLTYRAALNKIAHPATFCTFDEVPRDIAREALHTF